MALHDIDRNSHDRSAPAPNTHDKLDEVLRPAHGTVSVNPTQPDNPPTGYVKTKNAQIIINDGTNDRILIGYLQNGF